MKTEEVVHRKIHAELGKTMCKKHTKLDLKVTNHDEKVTCEKCKKLMNVYPERKTYKIEHH
jgi:hypothetical protein